MADKEINGLNKDIIKSLDELARTIYNLHSQYISQVARTKLIKAALPVFEALGLPLKFNDLNEYIELGLREPTAQYGGENKGKDEWAGDKTPAEDETPQRIRASYHLCNNLIDYIKNEPRYGLDLAKWLEKKCKLMCDYMANNNDILANADALYNLFGRINSEIIGVAEQYQDDKHKPKGYDFIDIANSLCRTSDKIEKALGL